VIRHQLHCEVVTVHIILISMMVTLKAKNINISPNITQNQLKPYFYKIGLLLTKLLIIITFKELPLNKHCFKGTVA
jgi:hypothetical protein